MHASIVHPFTIAYADKIRKMATFLSTSFWHALLQPMESSYTRLDWFSRSENTLMLTCSSSCIYMICLQKCRLDLHCLGLKPLLLQPSVICLRMIGDLPTADYFLNLLIKYKWNENNSSRHHSTITAEGCVLLHACERYIRRYGTWLKVVSLRNKE